MLAGVLIHIEAPNGGYELSRVFDQPWAMLTPLHVSVETQLAPYGRQVLLHFTHQACNPICQLFQVKLRTCGDVPGSKLRLVQLGHAICKRQFVMLERQLMMGKDRSSEIEDGGGVRSDCS